MHKRPEPPKEIYLQWTGIEGESSWCSDWVDENDVKYIRIEEDDTTKLHQKILQLEQQVKFRTDLLLNLNKELEVSLELVSGLETGYALTDSFIGGSEEEIQQWNKERDQVRRLTDLLWELYKAGTEE